MTHVIITRMIYKDDEPFNKRLELYKNKTLASIKKQTLQNFDVAVLCNPKHTGVLKDLGVIPFYLKEDAKFKVRYAGAHCSWDEMYGLEKYDVQTSINSDDWFSDNYVEKVFKILEKEPKDQSILVHFQPTLVNIKTGKEKTMKLRYRPNFGSAISSLYQPNRDNYYYIYHDIHKKMPKYFDKSILVEEGYCWLGIHKHNLSNTMNL